MYLQELKHRWMARLQSLEKACAADNKQRDPKMDTIKIDIKPEENLIKVYNNGKGIPVEHHKEQNMYVPTMIFGHLLTSSNFNDEEAKVTGGRNGFGAKLCNVFSTKFTVETACKDSKKEFKQSWGSNMSKASDPRIKPLTGEEFTRISFYPDLEKFQMTSLDKVLQICWFNFAIYCTRENQFQA